MPSATALAAAKGRHVQALAAVNPGTITIDAVNYDAAVETFRGVMSDGAGGYVQARRLTAHVLITEMAVSVVIDTESTSRPTRDGLIVVHNSVRYRLNEAKPDDSGVFLVLRCIEEHQVD